MLLNAIVLDAGVDENVFYDQATGAPKPGYSVRLTVLDADTKEKYECRVSEGLAGLDEIKRLKREGHGPDVLDQAANQLRTQLPPEMTRLPLEVLKFTGKSAAFIKLVCRFVSVPAAAPAP